MNLLHLRENYIVRTSLVVQWIRLHVLSEGDMGSTPGQGTEIPRAASTENANRS